MTTRKYPLPGLCLTGEELAKVARQKISGLSKEAALAVLQEVESEQVEPEADADFELIPKTAEDQEAFGVGVYMGTKEASRRFNELTTGKSALGFDEAMEKVAEEIGNFDAETQALRDQLTADPDQQLLVDMVEKVAQEDPAALAEFAAKKLADLGYEVKVADDDEEEAEEESDAAEGVEGEEEQEEEEETAAE